MKSTHAGKRIGRAGSHDNRPLMFLGASFAAHAVFLGMFALMPPAAHAIQLDPIDRNSRLVEIYAAAQEMIPPEPPPAAAGDAADSGGEEGAAAPGESGEMGNPERSNRDAAYDVARRHEGAVALPQQLSQQQVENAGAIGVIRQMTLAWNVPTTVFNPAEVNGDGEQDFWARVNGQRLGDAGGIGGLGMDGAGIGANGENGIVGIGNSFSTLGRTGRCDPRTGRCGTNGGIGDGHYPGDQAGNSLGSRLDDGNHGVPRFRPLPPTVSGSLSREAIRRVVHLHRNEVRACYEGGLQQRPDLAGRVVVGFIISPTGAVSSTAIGESSLGNQRVEQCITGAVRRWTFPQPDGGGVVSVSYPFLLESN